MTVIGWFRDLIHPKNFFEAQRPIITVTFHGGLTPFTLVKRRNGAVLQCTTFGYINSFIHTIVFIMCYLNAISRQESVTGYFFDSEISSIGDILQAATGIGALIMTLFYSIFRRQRLIDAYHSLARTDQHFKELGVEINYNGSLLRNFKIVIIQAFVQLMYCAISISIVYSSGVSLCVTVWMAFLLPFMMMSMVIILFVSLINQSKYRFSLLNKILTSLRGMRMEKRLLLYGGKKDIIEVETLQKPPEMASVFSNTNHCMPDVINRVASIQSEICDACDCVEDYFKVQMLTIIAISFLISVFDAYYILETIISDGSTNSPFSKLQFVAFFVYQGFIHIFSVMKVVYMSSLAAQENKLIAVNVHKLINANSYDEALTKQLTNLSLQLTHRKVAFTAYGFFKLDFTLLFTLIGAATTYLVILVQFSLNQTQTCDQRMMESFAANIQKNDSLLH